MSAEARAVVISLDVSRSKLVSLASLVSGGWLWLRELKLSVGAGATACETLRLPFLSVNRCDRR
jgi:hypothetical protein